MKPILFLPVIFVSALVLVLAVFKPHLSGFGTDAPVAPEQTVTIADKASEETPVFKSVSAATAAELVNEREGLLIVDVRTPQERKQFRIADSLLIPVGDVMRGRFMPRPDRPLLVVCAVGGRSYVAGKMMTARGHREVYNLDGGIESWRKAGLPIETGPENNANQ